MNPAWQVRASERQVFLDGLLREVYRFGDEENRKDTDYSIAKLCLGWLRDSETKEERPAVNKFFFGTIMPQIGTFSRGKEEELTIVANLLERLIDNMVGQFKMNLTTKESEDPQKFLHAASSMSEVEI